MANDGDAAADADGGDDAHAEHAMVTPACVGEGLRLERRNSKHWLVAISIVRWGQPRTITS